MPNFGFDPIVACTHAIFVLYFPSDVTQVSPPKYRLTTSSAKYLDGASETYVGKLADWYFSDGYAGERVHSIARRNCTYTIRYAGRYDSWPSI